MTDDRLTEDWLRRLKWALKAMPSEDREDIAAEARAHIEERVAAGRPAAEVLAEFGAPEAYAWRFVDEMETSGALGTQRSADLLGVVARRVHRNLVAAVCLLVVLALGVAGLTALGMVWVKLTDPVHAGLWIGPTQKFIGVIDDPSKAHEVLGFWLYPLAVLVLLLVWLVGRLVLLWAVRALQPRR